MIVEKILPPKLATTPTPSALTPCPFCVIGHPSKQVATDDGVPGIPVRIAEINPPEMPPIYSEVSSTTALTESME